MKILLSLIVGILHATTVLAASHICPGFGAYAPPDRSFHENYEAVEKLQPPPKATTITSGKRGQNTTVLSGLVPTPVRACLGSNSNPAAISVGTRNGQTLSFQLVEGGCTDLMVSSLAVEAACDPNRMTECKARYEKLTPAGHDPQCPPHTIGPWWTRLHAYVNQPKLPTQLSWKAWALIPVKKAAGPQWLVLSEEIKTIDVCSTTRGIKLLVSNNLSSSPTDTDGTITTTLECTRVAGKRIWIDLDSLPVGKPINISYKIIR